MSEYSKAQMVDFAIAEKPGPYSPGFEMVRRDLLHRVYTALKSEVRAQAERIKELEAGAMLASLTRRCREQSEFVASMRARAEKAEHRVAALEAVFEAAKTAHEYLKTLNGTWKCDPSINLHEPLCCIRQKLNESLNAAKEKQ